MCTVRAEIGDGFVWMTAAVSLIVFHGIIIEDCDGRMLKNHKYQEFYLSRYLMFRLLLNSLGRSLFSIFFSILFCMINFLNSLILISLSLASFSLSLRMMSFFSSSTFRLLHSIQRLLIFSIHIFQDSLYYDSSFIISDQIQEIISMVTMLGLPFFIFYLLYLIFYQISFSFLLFVIAFQWVLRSCFQFQAVFKLRVLHYSLILASWERVFYIFSLYFSSFFRKLRALACYFLTLRKEVFSAQSSFISFQSARMVFSFSTTEDSSQTYSFSFLMLKISFLSYSILISCFFASNFFSLVSSSIFSSILMPYFFLDFSLESIQSICSANSRTCFFNLMFCSINLSRSCSLGGSVFFGDYRQGEFWGQL